VNSKVRLNTKVMNIERNTKSRTKKVVVTLEDGSKHEADHVIFTGSLGVLKRHHSTLFTPQLPKRKILAIETSGYGTLGKIFLEYEKPFWPTDVRDWLGYSFLWTEGDMANITGTDREW
jgi:spermine oxidase